MTQPALHPAASGDRPAGALTVALVAEDETTARALHRCLANADLAVAGGPATLSRFDALEDHGADAVVLAVDVTRPGGLAALRRLRRDAPSSPVVVVGGLRASRHAARIALNADAAAYVPERDSSQALALAVRTVVAGFVCVPRATRSIVAKPSFSQREKEILGLLVGGLTNAQIARRLYLAESTVKTHLGSAFTKLGVHSRRDAAALLLDPDEGLAATALPLGAIADAGGPGLAGRR